MKNDNHVIVLVDDEENILKSLHRELRNTGREIKYFTEIDHAISYFMTHRVDLVVSDYRMPKMTGVEFLTKVKKIQPDIMSVILSGNSDLDFLKDAINKVGIYRFISKPWESFQLKTIINQALEYRDLQLENQRLADEVREKNDHIKQQRDELERLEKLQPGITKVNWDDDGAIFIDEDSIQ